MSAYLTSLIMFASIYLLLAWSLQITFYAGHYFFGQIGVMLVSSYMMGALLIGGIPWVLACLCAIGAGIVVAAALSLLGRRLSGFPLAISTIAAAESMQLCVSIFNIQGGVGGLSGIPGPIQWWHGLIAVGIAATLLGWFYNSISARAALALAEDEEAARSFGIRPQRLRFLLTLFAGLLAGLGGALYAGYVHYIEPDFFGFEMLVTILIYVVVGGVRSIWGPILGVGLLYLIPQYYFSAIGTYQLIAFSALGICTFIVAPDGIIGLLGRVTQFARRYARSKVTPDYSAVTMRIPGTLPPLDGESDGTVRMDHRSNS